LDEVVGITHNRNSQCLLFQTLSLASNLSSSTYGMSTIYISIINLKTIYTYGMNAGERRLFSSTSPRQLAPIYSRYLCSYRTCIHGSELTPTCADSPTGKCGPEVQVHLKLRKCLTCGHINHIVDIICVHAATPSLHSTGHIVLVAMYPTPISPTSTKSSYRSNRELKSWPLLA
jgi:hypothetical protein